VRRSGSENEPTRGARLAAEPGRWQIALKIGGTIQLLAHGCSIDGDDFAFCTPWVAWRRLALEMTKNDVATAAAACVRGIGQGARPPAPTS
jgi:hypothetical protein